MATVVNPLRFDPTRTVSLRRAFLAALARLYRTLRREVYDLIVQEDAFGLRGVSRTGTPISNRRWAYQSQDEAVKNFETWLHQRVYRGVMSQAEVERWKKYVARGFEKGAGRAFADTVSSRRTTSRGGKLSRGGGFVEGDRERFLREATGRASASEKLRLIQTQALSEVEGLGRDLVQKGRRALTEGLVRGETPEQIAARLAKVLKVSLTRAQTIANTELVRAHAEGQLAALEHLGVERVGVAVEWSTASGACPMCQPLEGVVLTLAEARGMLPRHPNCRCAWVPANVGEPRAGQKRSKTKIDRAVKKSEREGSGDWKPGSPITKDRPKSSVANHSSSCSCCEPLRKFALLMGVVDV